MNHIPSQIIHLQVHVVHVHLCNYKFTITVDGYS